MQIGLVGLPLAGKTTFFNLLTGLHQETGLTGKGAVHLGSAEVPDPRLDYLFKLCQPAKKVNARIQFKDIPGVRFDQGASLAAKIWEEVRGADVLVQVVRAFRNKLVSPVAGEPAPFTEISDLASELLLADMSAVESRLERITQARKPPKDAELQMAVLKKILTALENEQPAGSVPLDPEERQAICGQSFFSDKPLIIAVNLDQDQFATGSYPQREKVLDYTSRLNLPVIEACALIEAEISELPPADRPEFLADLGITEPGISRLARVAYECLGLISFFTIGEDEVRAWPIRRGTVARQAAGKVHTDMERGFIRAETVSFDDLYTLGSAAKAREKGLFRLEGKDYPVQDGDIINFRFNV